MHAQLDAIFTHTDGQFIPKLRRSDSLGLKRENGDMPVSQCISRNFQCDSLVPHGELHHAVEVGECENEVEEGVAVHDTIRFVQLHTLSTRNVVTTGAR